MQSLNDSGPPHGKDDAIWNAPGLRIEQTRSWGAVSAAVYQRGNGESTWRNTRHRLVLALTELGSVSTCIDGGRRLDMTVVRGKLGFYPADVTLDVVHGPGRIVQVLQDPAIFRSVALEISGRSDMVVEPILSFDDPLIAQIARTLAQEIKGGPANRLLVDGLSNALAVQVMRRFVTLMPPPLAERGLSRERVRRVLDYIEAHLADELTLAELAEVACLSPTHFSRCFKQAAGVGLSRYVMQRRVERAKDLIRRTPHPLAAIAQAVGFTDQSHFTNIFRRETGTTPGQFRIALA